MKRCFLCVSLATVVVCLAGCDKAKLRPNAADQQKKGEIESPVAAEVWSCPMHPQIKKEGPGKCPICGMDLVKKENGPQATPETRAALPEGHAAYSLSAERAQMIGVKVTTVTQKPVYKSIEAAGRVAFDPELYTAQSEYLEALAQQEQVKNSAISEVKTFATRMVESTKMRLKILGLSDAQIQGLRDRRSSLPTNLLVPKSGENLWIYAEVFEMDLPNINTGMSALITGEALGKKSFPAKVIAVDRVLNPQTRTAKVRIQLLDSKVQIRPESYVEVTILAPLGTHVTAPFDAIFDTGKQAWVFVVNDAGVFDPRLVTIGERAGDDVVIEEGLKVGEKIVTSANFLIDSESRLHAVGAAEAAGAGGAPEETKEKTQPTPSVPPCPEGQFWHKEMNHCMPKIGQ